MTNLNVTELVLQNIYTAIDEYNADALDEANLEKSIETILASDYAKLNSLGLITILISVETKINTNSGGEI